MPEGDTIFRAARTLNQALAGQIVTHFESALASLAAVDDQERIAGRMIERVVAAGKHLIIDFSGDLHLRTHMRMSGSWHIYRTGERWQRPRRDMRVVIATAEWVAVGFNIPVAEFGNTRAMQRQEDLRRMGPDFLGKTFDLDEAVRRIRLRPDEEIANVLLNQRVVAGAGNVYKSEALFMGGVNPFTHVREVSDERVIAILKTLRKLLLLNVSIDSAARRTTGSLDEQKKLWVYSRGSEPCRKCAAPIQYRKQGSDARGTYWCPQCQLSAAQSSMLD